MITTILSVVNWLTKHFRALTISFICILLVSAFFVYRQLQERNKEVARLRNNNEYYQSLFNSSQEANRTLQLTINDLNNTQDSIIQQLNETKKKLNVKDKNLEQAQVINTIIKDSITTIVKTKDIDFTQELKLNDLTTIIVSRKDSILTATLDLQNQQTLFIQKKKQYRNHYKTWLSRFFHFDFKKDISREYIINNSNKLIKVTDTRIIEISK